MGIIAFIFIGVLAGWLAGKLLRGGGFGFLANLGLGVAGSLVGGLLFGILGLKATGMIGSLITATAGAAVLLLAADALRRR